MDDLNALLDKLRDDDAEYDGLLRQILDKVNEIDTPSGSAKKDFPKPKPL